MKTLFGVLLLMFIGVSNALAQTKLVEWNFPNNPDNATADAGIAANLSNTISTGGATGTLSFGVSGASTNAATNTGWDNGNGTKYWLINFTTTGYTSITISSKQYSSATGPKNFKLQYQVGAGAWTDIAGTDVVVGNNFTSGVLANIILPADCNNEASVFVRWIMTSNTSEDNGTVGSSGTSRIDDILVRGVLISSVTNSTDHFRSKTSGDWYDPTSWQSSTNGSTWVDADLSPTSAANSITIQPTHTISILNNISADQLTISSGAFLNHASNAVFTLDNGSGVDMTINGTYIINGAIPSGTGTYTVESGGAIRADANIGGNSDDIAFQSNNKVLFKTGSVFEWNSSIFGTSGVTYFNSASEKPTFRISSNAGNVGSGGATVINGLLEVNGSITWDNGGTKAFRDGITGSGTITQTNTSGTLIIAGSTSAVLGGTGAINLDNAGLQISSGASVLLTGNKTVNNSNFINYGTLECQTFAITGSTTFTNANLATLLIGSPQGITASGATGNIQTSGRVFNSNGLYNYNGSVSQQTGTGLPVSVSILAVSNTGAAGNNTVTLTTNNTTVTNSFILNNGYFAAGSTGNLQIAAGGTIFGSGGHTINDPSAGNIVFLGSGSTIGITSGNPLLYSVIINGAVDFNGPGAGSATILNRLQLNAGSSVPDAPFYQGGSSLVYSTGGVYSRNVEWGSAGDQGYPHHVTVQAGTIVDLNSNPIGPAQLEIGGDLTVGNTNGSGQVYMNNSMNKPLWVRGNLIIGSTNSAANGSILWLSQTTGGDLWLEGSFTRYNNGSYTDNDRAIFFKGSGNASISTPDVSITPGTPTQYFSYALMDKTNGTEIVTLNCPVGITQIMTFTKGIVLSTANYPLVFNDNSAVSGASDLSFVNGPVKKIGNDAFLFPVGKPLISSPSVGGYRYIGITPVSNTSTTDAFTAEFIQSSATALGPITDPLITRVSRCEYWKLDKTNGAANLAVHVTASWTARSNCNVVGSVPYISDLPTLAIAHFNGTSWNAAGGFGNYGGGSTVASGNITWNNVSVFSPFSLASTDFLENLLPLDVSGFNARARTTDVAIDWMVSNNNEQDEFILERSRDGIRFENLKVVPVKVILFTATYAEEDKQPYQGWNYYRLRAVDKLGKERISRVIKVWFGRDQQIRVSPNPASEKIIVSFAEPSSISQIELVNISGQVLQRIQTMKFNNEINISHLQAGMYYLRISGKNGLSTKSFIKQ